MGRTRTAPSTCAVRRTNAMAQALSAAGSVLGIAQMVVKPPRAAASVPVAIVSLCSKPGWRRWVWMSTKPGQTMSPDASMASGAPLPAPGPTAAMRPSSISTSATASRPFAGSMTRPPRMARGLVMSVTVSSIQRCLVVLDLYDFAAEVAEVSRRQLPDGLKLCGDPPTIGFPVVGHEARPLPEYKPPVLFSGAFSDELCDLTIVVKG